jgi:hypothetical protein
MNGKMDREYDTEEGEVFDLEIEYEYVPYHPADWNGPAEGGGCEEIIFKVVGYRQFDEDGKLIQDLEKLTPEKSKELTNKFDKMVSNSQRLTDYFQDLCTKDAEDRREPDYDD